MIGNFHKSIEKELSAGLLRQRRNLVVISLVMPLFFLSGASINEINMFGTVIKLQSQSGVNIVLFAIYFYFLWRYFQYYLEEDRARDFIALRNHKIDQAEFDYLKHLMFIKTNCFEMDHYHPCYKKRPTRAFSEDQLSSEWDLDKKIGRYKKSRTMEVYGLPDKYIHHYSQNQELRNKLPSNEIDCIEKQWRYVEKKQGDSRSGAIFETDVVFNWPYLNWLRFKEGFVFYIVHPYFSDYKLPFLIATMSLAVSIYVCIII